MDGFKKAFVYARVSTAVQVEIGQGIDVQLKLCRDFCKQAKLDIVAEFTDKGISGANEADGALVSDIDRAGLQDMLAALNGVDYIVVSNSSRLWRDDFTRALIQRELKKAKKDVKVVENPKYSLYAETPESYLINKFMEAMDDYERLSIILKLKRGRNAKAARGQKASGPAPLGYEWSERKAGGRREKIIVPVADEAELVKNIFNAYVRLGNIAKVQKLLTSRELTHRSGKPFSHQALHNILTNEVYIGIVRHGDLEIAGQHEPIISKVVFGRAKAVALGGKYRRANRRPIGRMPRWATHLLRV
jgi:site-specific DNA recombinase